MEMRSLRSRCKAPRPWGYCATKNIMSKQRSLRRMARAQTRSWGRAGFSCIPGLAEQRLAANTHSHHWTKWNSHTDSPGERCVRREWIAENRQRSSESRLLWSPKGRSWTYPTWGTGVWRRPSIRAWREWAFTMWLKWPWESRCWRQPLRF